MKKWLGHSLFNRKLLASCPFLPFWARACSPDPFPPLLYILVVHLGWLYPHSAYIHSFFCSVGLRISVCAVLYSQPTSCYYCANSSLSLLCNLISSSWFPIIANSDGKRKLPQNPNDHKLKSQRITIGEEGRGAIKSPSHSIVQDLHGILSLYFVLKHLYDNKPFLCARKSSEGCTCWTHLILATVLRGRSCGWWSCI